MKDQLVIIVSSKQLEGTISHKTFGTDLISVKKAEQYFLHTINSLSKIPLNKKEENIVLENGFYEDSAGNFSQIAWEILNASKDTTIGDQNGKLNEAIRFSLSLQQQSDHELSFLVHNIDIMHRLILTGIKDEDILIAAVLHGSLKSAPVSRKIIKAKFGKKVRDLIVELSAPTWSLSSFKEECECLCSFAESASDEAVIIKTIERMSGVLSLLYPEKDTMLQYALFFAQQIYRLYERILGSVSMIDNYPTVRENIIEELICLNKRFEGIGSIFNKPVSWECDGTN